MPWTSGKRKAYPKRKYIPRKKSVARKASPIPKHITVDAALGFPEVNLVRLRYVDVQVYTWSASFAMQNYVWGANCLFDPYIAAGGHQPMGFDQLMVYYQLAFVEKSSIVATFSSDSTTLGEPVRCGVFLYENTTPYSTWTSYEEAGVKTVSLSNNATKPVKAYAHYDNKKLYGGKAEDSVTDFANSSGSNPLRTPLYTVWAQPETLANLATGTISVTVAIDYLVRFYDKRPIAAS